MSINFTINPIYESRMLSYSHVVSAANLLVAGLTLYLIYFKSHRKSQSYKMLLFNVVICTTLGDLLLGVIFIPMPLFPLPGGYFLGPACDIGIPLHFGLTVIFVDGVAIAAGMNNCFFFRHQAVLPNDSPLKLTNCSFKIVCIFNYLILQLPNVLMACAYAETLNGEKFLREFHPGMMWLTEKSNWIVYNSQSETSLSKLVIKCFGCICSTYTTTCFLQIAHIFKILSKQSHLMSEHTKELHRKLTVSLILQYSILSVILGIPQVVYYTSIWTAAIPYEINWLCFCIQLLHSMAHSVALIYTTQTYKDAISEGLTFKKPTTVAVAQSSMTE